MHVIMKKLLYTIGIMMFASAALSPLISTISSAQFSGADKDVPFSTARLSSKLIEATGLNPAANWAEIFGTKDEKEVGQDLYMLIYKKTQDEPEKKAFKNTAGKYGMSEADLVLVLNGNYTNLLKKKPGMRQEELIAKISEIQQIAKEEKELQSLQADIKASVEPNEIFANGDLTDSGFDLINDLQIIENLLFLKSDPIDVGKDYVASESGAEPTPPETPAPPAGTPPGGTTPGGHTPASPSVTPAGTQEENPAGTQESGAVVPGQPPAGGGGATGGAPAGEGAAAGATTAEGKLNPNSCFAGTSVDAALKDFDEKKKTDTNYKDNSANQPASPKSSTTGGSGTGGAGGSGSPGGSDAGSGGSGGAAGGEGPTGTASAFLAIKPETTPPVQPAPAATWTKPKECTDVFCMYVNFISAPMTTKYKTSDNCIACHAEKINDILKKVINTTLIPSKAPGNLGESAKCKKAMSIGFGSISMFMYATPMPILTPPNDDLVFGTNIEDDWYNYCNTVAFPFSCRKQAPPASLNESKYEIPPSVVDMVSKDATLNASGSTTFAVLAKKIDAATTGFEQAKNVGMQQYSVAQGADKAIGFYNPLKSELEQMNYYFANIRDILHSLHEKAGEGDIPHNIPGPQACIDIKNKKECE